MRTAIVLFASVLVTCCASIEPQQFVGPSGKTAYSMRCGRTLDACYKKAGEVCPSGYTIIDRASGTVAVDGMAVPRYQIAIECK